MAAGVTEVPWMFSDSRRCSGARAGTSESVTAVFASLRTLRLLMAPIACAARSVTAVPERSAQTIRSRTGARTARSASPKPPPSGAAFRHRSADWRDS